MNLRFRFPTTLLIAALLLSTLGCSKKEEAKPTAATGSYTFDGVRKPCVVNSTLSLVNSFHPTYDELTITLTPLSQPTGGGEAVALGFHKTPGGPATDYRLAVLVYTSDVASSGKLYTVDVTTLQEAAGSYEGTFAGSAIYIGYSPPGTHTITDGVFTNVRP